MEEMIIMKRKNTLKSRLMLIFPKRYSHETRYLENKRVLEIKNTIAK